MVQKNQTMIVLTLYKEWYDKILNGTKKVEYRKNTEYWQKRLLGKGITTVEFRNGYGKSVPHFRADISCISTTPKFILLKISAVYKHVSGKIYINNSKH